MGHAFDRASFTPEGFGAAAVALDRLIADALELKAALARIGE